MAVPAVRRGDDVTDPRMSESPHRARLLTYRSVNEPRNGVALVERRDALLHHPDQQHLFVGTQNFFAVHEPEHLQ